MGKKIVFRTDFDAFGTDKVQQDFEIMKKRAGFSVPDNLFSQNFLFVRGKLRLIRKLYDLSQWFTS